jgi:hypothetical protein
LLTDLLESYLKDFPKCSSKLSDLKYLDMVFSRIPHVVGNQFKFVQISRDIQSIPLYAFGSWLEKSRGLS